MQTFDQNLRIAMIRFSSAVDPCGPRFIGFASMPLRGIHRT